MKWMLVCLIFYGSFIFAGDIAVVTLVVGKQYKEAVGSSIENKQNYCKQHGYDFICGEESLDLSRPIPWSKIKLIQKVMRNPKYKWIFWTDADSLIMNMGIPLEDLIHDEYNFILCKDTGSINTGQFFIKNCDWSHNLLNKVYEHTECINHQWWEQQAFIIELQNEQYWPFIKILPQRHLNSYAVEVVGNNSTGCYKKGDFIIHFAGAHDREQLSRLFSQYNKKIVNNNDLITLDYYLDTYGFKMSAMHSIVNEGYMSNAQKEQFKKQLLLYPNIQSIAEIGLNGGHSANNFFESCKNLKKFVSFDIGIHDYTEVAANFFRRKYKQRFVFVRGDSLVEVSKYASLFPQEKFDLIYIDGNHAYEYCLNDIINCQKIAHPNTVLWIDDVNAEIIRKAILDCAEKGIIAIEQIFDSTDPEAGGRGWVQARYLKI